VAGLVGFVAILLGAGVTYRIATDKGELVIKTDDPSIEVVVKQGGRRVTIIDPQTKTQIELHSGKYELELAGGKPGLRLSAQQLTLKRGDKTVVTVRREPPEPPQRPETASELPSTGEQPALVEVAPFRGHVEPIDGLAVSPDGRRLLSGSCDDWLILWDRETAQPIRRFEGHAGEVMAVAISPDGRRALYGGEDKIIRLLDLESGEPIREFRGHTERVFSVAFSPDGRRAYSSSGGSKNGVWQDGTDSAIRVWDVETGRQVSKLEGHKGIVWSVAVSPDGRHLLSAGNDTLAILWDAKTGAEIRRFREHTVEARCAAFLPDGRRAVSCGNDRTIRLWDVATGQEIRSFRGHAHSVGWLAVSPDGHWLLSSDHEGGELWLWDVETSQTVQRINWGNVIPIHGSFTPDGRHAIWTGSDGVIRMYRLSAPDKDKADPTAPPAKPAAAGQNPSIPLAKVAPKPLSSLVRSRRWDWIHDASLPEFYGWIKRIEARGYRPVFVNGHNIAPDVVRIAAIAVKDGLPFRILDEADGNYFPRFVEMQKQGFPLLCQTTFNMGATARVLSINTSRDQNTGQWHWEARSLSDTFIVEREREGVRPFSIATRPQGDSWHVEIGTIASKGIEWRFKKELDFSQMDLTLNGAKQGGFRPESLFVCPGKESPRFGVVLTRDDPERLWNVRADLTAAKLESEVARMAALGYAPDQVVGYASGDASRYLACWTRNPRHYPATGVSDPSLDPVDEALEQFLVERRIPSATFAVFRNGRPALARGYGYADLKSREPIGPAPSMRLGGLSAPFAAAAARRLIRGGKLREDARLSEMLRLPSGGDVAQRSPSSPAAVPPDVTVGRLLEGLDPAATPFTDAERKALAAMIGKGSSPPPGPSPMADFELRGALLEAILAAVKGKRPSEVMASDLFGSSRQARMAPGTAGARAEQAQDHLLASAEVVGAFFVKHGFDGRPLEPRSRPGAGALIGRREDALGLVLRRGDWLLVVLAKVADGAPRELGDDLRTCLDRALDSIVPVASSPESRRPSPR
jgi:WD40 repeat protein